MSNHPLAKGHPPAWASGWGEDQYGVFTEFMLKGVTQRLRWIPPGRFTMGSPEDEPGRFSHEGPQHDVVIEQGYWVMDTPVTQALWQAVMGENPSTFVSPERPVEQVSLQDAQRFITTLNAALPGLDLSLPSEAQWEYACRAGTDTALYNGEIAILGDNNAPALDAIAWYGGNSGEGFELDNGYDSSDWPEKQYEHKTAGSHTVKAKDPNPWGLYDMLGNVWEWTEDPWHKDYQGAPTDGSAWLEAPSGPQDPAEPEQGQDEAPRVVRGGSWDGLARSVRCAVRRRYRPGLRVGYLGFRCVRVQVEPSDGVRAGGRDEGGRLT